jgi:uncharacterized protein
MFALITGGSKGIGKAMAIELAKRKYGLLLVARSEKLLHEVSAEIAKAHGVVVHYLALDLSAPSAPQQVYDWCVKNNYTVEILINNAGYGLCGKLDDYSLADNTNMLQLNINAVTEMCQLFLPMLKRQKAARILNIAGGIAYQAAGNMALYGASKAFILYFSRALRAELKGTGVTVTCLSPGATDTDFVSRAKIKTKALKAAEKVNMRPEAVARIAISSMMAGKAEVIPGLINKLSVFFAWLLPKAIVEKTATGIYE